MIVNKEKHPTLEAHFNETEQNPDNIHEYLQNLIAQDDFEIVNAVLAGVDSNILLDLVEGVLTDYGFGQ